MLKESLLNLSVVTWVTIYWWQLFLSWILLLFVLWSLDSTGKCIKEYARSAYICAFLACVSCNSFQIKYLLTRGVFISVNLRFIYIASWSRKNFKSSVKGLCCAGRLLSDMLCRTEHFFFFKEGYMEGNTLFILVLWW